MVVVNIPVGEGVKPIHYYVEPRLKDRIDKKIKGVLEKKDKDYVMVIDGAEGCLAKDTLLKTKKGIMTIEELYKSNKPSYMQSHNFLSKKDEYGKIGVVDSGLKEIFEITTNDGRKIKATSEHKFFVYKNGNIFKMPLSDLKEGDKLICN